MAASSKAQAISLYRAAMFSALYLPLLFFTLVTVRSQTRLGASAAGSAKVAVCHVPPGNPENAQSVTVSNYAWENGHTPHNLHDRDFLITEANTCPPPVEPPTEEFEDTECLDADCGE